MFFIRFNNRKQNIYKVLLGMFRKESLKLSWPKIINKHWLKWVTVFSVF